MSEDKPMGALTVRIAQCEDECKVLLTIPLDNGGVCTALLGRQDRKGIICLLDTYSRACDRIEAGGNLQEEVAVANSEARLVMQGDCWVRPNSTNPEDVL